MIQLEERSQLISLSSFDFPLVPAQLSFNTRECTAGSLPRFPA
jgi:hypothetical protein